MSDPAARVPTVDALTKERDDLRARLAVVVQERDEALSCLPDAIWTINSIHDGAVFCDCLSFEMAQAWRNRWHGGALCPTKQEQDETGIDARSCRIEESER